MLEELAEHVPFWRHYNFSSAILRAFNNEDFVYKRFVHKLKQSPLKRYASKADYLRAIEELYNHHLQDDEKRIRLY